MIMAKNTEFSYTRTLLSETRQALGNLFEGGFLHQSASGNELDRLAEKLAQCGLDAGASLLEELSGKLTASRLHSQWNWTGEISLYARLWKYLDLCQDRLDYLEALDSMSN